ncbi:MAG: transposase [Chitinophagales bacterium]|jgi:REP element-mobilizing transposase RayT
MRFITPIEKGKYYHIYNRGINGENIFKTEENYFFFLEKWAQYVSPVADTYAYCLLKNHFHFLIRIKDEDVFICRDNEEKLVIPSQQFSNLFNSYAQSFNKVYERTGSLFESPFRRKEVDNPSYFCHLIAYIHLNPERHKFVENYKAYPYSSYGALLSSKSTKLRRDDVMRWFEEKDNFKRFHATFKDHSGMKELAIEEDYFS